MIITKRLTQESPIIFDSNKERIININTISLESCDEKLPIDIFCENKRKKEKFKICSLKKGFQETYSTSLMLDLHNLKDKYEFSIKTKCKQASVNIIGFYDEEEEEKDEQEKKIIEKKDKEIEKEKEKEKEKSSEEKSDSDSENDEDNNVEENKPNVSLVELLNKKRKEEPQEIKPVTLKNLVQKNKNEDKKISKELINNKDKDKNKDNNKNNNLGKKLDKKDKKIIKK